MSRPSEPMLAWLRKLVDGRGLNAAQVAGKAGLPRARLRKILVGAEPMLVDELVQISNALEIQPSEMGLSGQLVEETPSLLPDPEAVPASPTPAVDPWGNHPEQLFRVGFALGCDFFFLAKADDLVGCGVPAQVLAQYHGGEMPIRLDAQYHSYNAPRYDESGVTIRLSFDAVYECRFPWASIRQVIFFPAMPDPVTLDPPSEDEDPKPPKPHLRLVT